MFIEDRADKHSGPTPRGRGPSAALIKQAAKPTINSASSLPILDQVRTGLRSLAQVNESFEEVSDLLDPGLGTSRGHKPRNQTAL